MQQVYPDLATDVSTWQETVVVKPMRHHPGTSEGLGELTRLEEGAGYKSIGLWRLCIGEK